MSTLNPFDLLGDDDNDDPSQLIAAAQKQKEAAAAAAAMTAKKSSAAAPAAKMPTKPVPPSQAVKEAKNAAPTRGGFGRGGSRGGRFQNRDFGSRNENGFSGNYGNDNIVEEGDGKASERHGGYGGPPQQSFRGGRRGEYGGNAEGDAANDTERPPRRPYERRSETGRGYEMKREGGRRGEYGGNAEGVAANDTERPPRRPYERRSETGRGYEMKHEGGRRGEYGGNAEGDAANDTERPPRRPYERRSGTGRGYEMKREGAGRANWGNMNDDLVASQEVDENVAGVEKPAEQENGDVVDGGKDNKEIVSKVEEKPEEKEMTLEEYEKLREEKRKALLALKAEERKVTIDKELESMQLLSVKKENDEIFVKLGLNKEPKKKEIEREEKARKSLTIQEFLKPAEGERSYGRGHGRGRIERGGGGRGGSVINGSPPAIEDNRQFPTLGKN